MTRYKLIRVHTEDEERLMGECIKIFLAAHPEMKGYDLSRAFMMCKVIDYYIETFKPGAPHK